jgi:peptide chain release factor subunit 1
VFFSGAIPQNSQRGTEKNEIYIIDPPEPITTFKYRCDNQFQLQLLEEMLENNLTYGLIVIGGKRATIGYISGTKPHIIKNFNSGIPSKHRKGGQSNPKFDREHLIKVRRFIRRMINHVNKEFLKLENVKAIFIGGAGNLKKKFLKDKNIDYRIRPLFKTPVDLAYDGGYEGIRALLNKISDKITDLQFSKEKQLIQKFLNEVSTDSGLAIYGYEEVKQALIYNTVKILIISKGLENVNDFMPLANKNSVQVEIISKETEEGEMLYKAFGGIAAIARYST